MLVQEANAGEPAWTSITCEACGFDDVVVKVWLKESSAPPALGGPTPGDLQPPFVTVPSSAPYSQGFKTIWSAGPDQVLLWDLKTTFPSVGDGPALAGPRDSVGGRVSVFHIVEEAGAIERRNDVDVPTTKSIMMR